MLYVNRGIVYAMKGEFDKAIPDYDKAIQLDSKYARPYYFRGVAYKALGRNTEAIADFKTCIKLTQEPSMIQAAKEALQKLQSRWPQH